ncbi:MAG TPA: hypothetical protein VHK88_14225 [Aquihabitans sp.]|jgi:4-hydroxybenzoate polyprenyltransferase|nr:hypothetical protein [Aquihabitans sp.]
MATTTPGTGAYSATSHTEGASRTGIRRFTETKAGPKTTEFMLALLFAVAAVVAAYLNNSDSLSRDDGWRYASIAIAAYVISRGLAKLGVREPYTDDNDGR